jgi:hypothetical protein
MTSGIFELEGAPGNRPGAADAVDVVGAASNMA